MSPLISSLFDKTHGQKNYNIFFAVATGIQRFCLSQKIRKALYLIDFGNDH